MKPREGDDEGEGSVPFDSAFQEALQQQQMTAEPVVIEQEEEAGTCFWKVRVPRKRSRSID